MEDLKNKKFSFGYEDTDKKIEMSFYGINFKINNIRDIDKFENLDRKNKNIIEAQIDEILGNGAVDKMNKKRLADGYEELDIDIELTILGLIMETYAKASADKVIGKVTKAVDEINNDVNSFNNMNREQRRNYNRNQNRNRRNYRRY